MARLSGALVLNPGADVSAAAGCKAPRSVPQPLHIERNCL